MVATINGFALLGQSQEDLKRLEGFKKIVNTPVVYKSSKTSLVKKQTDILYDAKSGSPSRGMNIYWSDGKASKPLVVLIHGKTPIKTDPKDWGVYESWGNILAKEGFVCVIFNHSLSKPGKTLDDAASDVNAAIAFVKSQSNRYNIDTTKMALYSFSAGAPLMNYGFLKEDKNVKALICFYGFLDLEGVKLYGEMDSRTNQKFSLTKYLSNPEKFPPIFIAQAGKENNQNLNASINKFLTLASINNAPVTYYNHPAGVHGFDNQNDDNRTKEIIEAMLAFLHKHLKAN